MKYCKGCRTRKAYSHFAPHARLCIECQAARAEQRRQYLANWRRQHGAEAQRRWRKKNPGYDKDYYCRRKKERGA